jgi:hypothetical protein
MVDISFLGYHIFRFTTPTLLLQWSNNEIKTNQTWEKIKKEI